MNIGSNQQRWQEIKRQAVRLAFKFDLKDGPPDEPRDESGKWTTGGGSGGSGESAGAAPAAALQGEIAADMKPPPKEKGKFKVDDFGKAGIMLDSSTRAEHEEKSKKFIERWNDTVRDAPEDFKQKFLGGLKGTMTMSYDDDDDKISMRGYILDEDGDKLGEYTRHIDFDEHKAESAYFKLEDSAQGHGVGKQMLAGNIATYQQLGLHKVEVHANIDIGGHAWARYGYVPTRQSWPTLRRYLAGKIDDLEHGELGDGYTAESWDDMSSSQQDHIRDAWIEQNRDEIHSNDVENWRDQGGDLHEAKIDLVHQFSATPFGKTSKWVEDVLKDETTTVTVREERQGELFGQKPLEQQVKVSELIDTEKLIGAISMDYKDQYGEGRGDPEISIDEDKTPELNDEQRDEIVSVLTEKFNEEAESNRSDVDPPSWVDDQASESAAEYFDSMRDRDKYKWAQENDELPTGEPERNSDGGEMSAEDADSLRDLLNNDNPKALWQIADSKWGKKLLIDADWWGEIDLGDKQTMDRFNAYVGKKPSQKAAA
jgi:GNAT superfamily N-acetyltransferase